MTHPCAASSSWSPILSRRQKSGRTAIPPSKQDASLLRCTGHGRLIQTPFIHPTPQKTMEQYTLVLMKSGQKWNPEATAFMEAAKQHHEFVKQMIDNQKIAIAGH